MNTISPPERTLSQRLAAYVCEERLERIDRRAIERTKQIIAYHVGLAFRSLRTDDADSRQAIAIARALSGDCGESTIIGRAQRTTIAEAAFVNCTLMRAGGLDDVIFPAGVHPALVSLPVALALTERHRCSGAELITAIVVAYELLGKFGRFGWSLDTPRRPVMLVGSFGATAAAGRLLGLDHASMSNAIGYAAHTTMGLAEGTSGPITHYYSLLCRNGIAGAYAAQAGGACSPAVLEGRFGYLESFLGSAEIDQDAIVGSFGHDYMVMNSCEKRYPGTALNQVPIELMRTMIQDHGLNAANVQGVNLAIPAERQNFDTGLGKGPFRSRPPAVSSVAFQLAILLLDGENRPERYDDFANPEIQAEVDKVELEFVTGKPIRYARLEVLTTDGCLFVAEGDDFIFPPEPPRAVMDRHAGDILPQARIDRFIDLLETLETLPDAAELITALRP